MMSSSTGFHPDETDRQIGQTGLQLPARDLAAQHGPAACIHPDQVEGILDQVDPDRGNALKGGLVSHGMAPWLRDIPVPPCSAGKHGRPMPLKSQMAAECARADVREERRVWTEQ